jgi:hypothetical protein
MNTQTQPSQDPSRSQPTHAALDEDPKALPVEFLPLCQNFDQLLDYFLLTKLVANRLHISRDELLTLLQRHQTTGLTLGHLLVKQGYCSITEAIALLTEHRFLKSRLIAEGA